MNYFFKIQELEEENLNNKNNKNKKRKGDDGNEIKIVDTPLTEEEFLKFKMLHTTGKFIKIWFNMFFILIF